MDAEIGVCYVGVVPAPAAEVAVVVEVAVVGAVVEGEGEPERASCEGRGGREVCGDHEG